MPWNLNNDAPIPTAEELNRAVADLRRQSIVSPAPPIHAIFGSFGWLIRLASSPTNQDAGTLSARLGASNGNVYAWTEQIVQGGVLVPRPGGLQSDVNTDPAIEQNGRANIAAGTPVELMRVFSPTYNRFRWVFYHQERQPTTFVVADYGQGYEGTNIVMS